MKTIRILFQFYWLLTGLSTSAQQFEKENEIDLPNGFQGLEFHWLDLDHDELLDLVVVAKDASGDLFFLLYKNTDHQLAYEAQVALEMQHAVTAFADMNRDGQVDIVVSGGQGIESFTTVFFNNSDFSFTRAAQPLVLQSGTLLELADLNQDGIHELIISGSDSEGPFLRIFRLQSDTWTLARDSVRLHASSIDVFDFDRDGVNDLFVSGQLEDDSQYHAILLNDKSMNFRDQIMVEGITDALPWLADINYDGIFDVVLAGKSNGGNGIVIALASNPDGEFEIQEIQTLDFIPQALFVADLDSDGKIDIQVTGKNDAEEYFNRIFLDNGFVLDLPEEGLTIQRFGDFDYDGDLDLVQLTGSGTKMVQYVNPIGVPNEVPGPPSDPVTALIYGTLFLYWDKPLDDHTPQSSLTYDITLQTEGVEMVTGNFDLLNETRLQVVHGNNGTQNHAFFRKWPAAQFQFFIQSIDNAYHAGKNVCKGSGTAWNVIAEETVVICQSENAVLSAGENALWFSLRNGFLGETQEHVYKPEEPDTVFALIRHPENVTEIKLFRIEIREAYVKEFLETIYVCENEELAFEADGDWPVVEWSSVLKGFISNETSITYQATLPDTVKLFQTDESGCGEMHRTAINISKPIIALNGEVFHILKGSDVQLVASGGAQYSWQPPTGLNNPDIANPVASPIVTTEYTVTATDSIGCTASAKVRVIVEAVAFIPNLFTPNQDGKNDNLKVYGLGPVKSFSLSIYNREGNMVFSTNDITEATQSGWDGTVRGVLQPGGVYYWKVMGEHQNGSKLLLNGKESGSVVLIR
jgi:gliding motility-associated-like protein